ncbi:MAG TPA: hypothetical protein VD971_13500 [Phycisphaerales bacterium]|nr:hypothetical protein [Phycisphaerales bacterium]
MKTATGIAALALIACAASAEFIRRSSPLESPAAMINFEDRTLPRFTEITNQYQAQGVVFPTPVQWNRILNDFPNITGNRVGTNPPFSLRVRFTQPQTRAAFAIGCNSSVLQVRAKLGEQALETVVINMALFDPTNVIGFEGVTFDEIEVTQLSQSGSPGMIIDTIHFGSTQPSCDSIDFNGDGLFPDNQDLVDFLSVFGGGACSNDPSCGDLDFNNDGLFPDNEDIRSLLRVFGGGACT